VDCLSGEVAMKIARARSNKSNWVIADVAVVAAFLVSVASEASNKHCVS